MLTDAKIQGLKPPQSGVAEIRDEGRGAVVGLRVRIGQSGRPSFLLRVRIGARMRVLTLGRYGPRFGLAIARKMARQVVADLEAGRDPATEVHRHKRRDRETIQPLYEQWRKDHLSQLRSGKEVCRIFERYVLPEIGARLAGGIERKDIIRLVDGVVHGNPARAAPVMGRAVLAQLSSFFSWCVGRDMVAANPCSGVRKPAAPRARDRVLTNDQLVRLWHACDEEGWPFGSAVQLLILTGARRSEVFEARWSEFNLADALWTLPPERAKNARVHQIPLSVPAMQLLARMPQQNGQPWLFPARGGIGRAASGISRAKARLDAAIGASDWVLHDIRRTVATGMQRLGVRLEVTEAVLNHVSGTRAGIVGVYQRHEYAAEKHTALEAWSAFLVKAIGCEHPALSLSAGTDRTVLSFYIDDHEGETSNG